MKRLLSTRALIISVLLKYTLYFKPRSSYLTTWVSEEFSHLLNNLPHGIQPNHSTGFLRSGIFGFCFCKWKTGLSNVARKQVTTTCPRLTSAQWDKWYWAPVHGMRRDETMCAFLCVCVYTQECAHVFLSACVHVFYTSNTRVLLIWGKCHTTEPY